MIELTVKELRELAKKKGLTGFSTLKKQELIEKLEELENDSKTEEETSAKSDLDFETAKNLLAQITNKNKAEEKNEDLKEETKIDPKLLSEASSFNLSKLINDIIKEEKKDGPINIFEENNNYEKVKLASGREVKLNRETDAIKDGYLNILPDGYGFIRNKDMRMSNDDVYISSTFIKQYGAKEGDRIQCIVRKNVDNSKNSAVIYVISINDYDPVVGEEKLEVENDNNLEEVSEQETVTPFSKLTPVHPYKHIVLEDEPDNLTLRMIDMIAPIGMGQRGLIVSPPKAGKTTILKNIAKAIKKNDPEDKIELIVLLIDERPEEVTDMKRSVKGTVVASTFDMPATNHIKMAENVIENAKKMVEQGKDVIILLDSITRLARAYNLVVPSSGKTLSGGFDPGALHKPKKFFGAARQTEEAGSLTIIATALVETGSRMDDLIFEEFKGTGNMELHLDREIAENRVYPAINVKKSGTRREDLLLTPELHKFMTYIRQNLPGKNTTDTTRQILTLLRKSKSNKELAEEVLKQAFGPNMEDRREN